MKIGGTILKRIGIYFFCVVALGCVTSGILYRKADRIDEIRVEKEIESVPETSKEDEVIAVSDSLKTEGKFFAVEEDGYLVIYDRVSRNRYDETTILIRELPEDLQEKIAEGLYFTDEEALYAFLENYSS